MEAAAERACQHIGYRNAGTIEFLVGPDGSFSFIEMNTRLQVEHPVTELLCSIDLVREQVRIAAGEKLAHGGRCGPRSGHVIELRINAEDPANDFAPAPGRVTRFRPPLGPGVRVDTFIEEGATIPPFYDSLIAKVIVKDASRKLAIDRAIRVLGEFEIEGVPTTRAVLAEILASDEFRSGEYSTVVPRGGGREASVAGGRVSRVLVSDDRGSVRLSEAALVKLLDGAVAAVEGARLRKRRRLSVELADGHARAELEISLPYGGVVPEAARVVQENVARVLTQICGAEVDAVDIAVVELTR